MTEEYQAPLSFSLKEAVWFKKGQEVADLLSIELNPQIGIEEKADYVQVKGTLELYGEYNKEETDTPFSLRDFSQEKTIEEVTKREDGVYVFTHYFPIDITIPKTRVKDVEDIYVLIDSFDYELPESNALQIVADLSITGLCEEENREEEIAEQEEDGLEEDEYLTEATLEETFEAFAFEARKSPVEEVEEVEEEEAVEEIEGIGKKVEIKGIVEEVETEETEETEEEVEIEGIAEVVEIAEEEEPVEAVENAYETREPKKAGEYSHLELLNRQVAFEDVEVVDSSEVESQEETELQQEEKTVPRSENALYLTRIFGHGEEKFRQVRMYIVQSGDTLDSIAEKYELQVQQITRRNQLDDGYVTEGQILYLPTKKSNS